MVGRALLGSDKYTKGKGRRETETERDRDRERHRHSETETEDSFWKVIGRHRDEDAVKSMQI